jgi:hypothetical protein
MAGIAPKGMPGFAEVLTAEEVGAIHAYLIKRAHDEKPMPAAGKSRLTGRRSS